MTENPLITPDELLQESLLIRYMDRGAAHATHGIDSRDVVQNVAEKLLKLDLAPTKSYVRRMLQNAAIDEHRARIVRTKNEDAYAHLYMDADERTPERTAQWSQALGELEKAIGELDPISEEIFFLCAVEGHTQTKAASELGLSLSTIEKRLAKAKRHCYQRIQPFVESP